MITPLTITSLDQGKALARRQVERLYAEPVEPATTVAIEEPVIADATIVPVRAAQHPRRSLVVRLLAFRGWFAPAGA